MCEFIKGWRRKAGLGTLALACVFVGGWLRSRDTYDVISLTAFGRFNVVESELGRIRWLACDHDQSEWQELGWRSHSRNEPSWRYVVHTEIAMRYLGKHAWAFGLNYRLIVLPLTLLSVWLILEKPRKAKPAADFRLATRDESSK